MAKDGKNYNSNFGQTRVSLRR